MNLLTESKLLRLAVNPPRVHGNGFIQLDLGPGFRVNFWNHPSIPRQKVDTGMHDHAFSFISEVLKGRMINHRVKPAMGTSYRVYHPEARDGEDTQLVPSGLLCELAPTRNETVGQGGSYHMLAGEVHWTEPVGQTITLMRSIKATGKLTEFLKPPRVFVAADAEPDNEFNRNSFSVSDLWDIIEEMINGKS